MASVSGMKRATRRAEVYARNEVEAILTAPRQPRDRVGAHHYYRGRVASRVKRCLDLSSHLLAGNERSIWAKEGVKKKQDNLGDFKPASAYGSLAASTSTFSMAGAVAKSSDALAISAAATLPER